jgi:VWFA-related protein
VTLSLKAIDQLAVSEGARPGRKAIVWISPGWPMLTGARVQLDNKQEAQAFGEIVGLSTQLLGAGVTLYSVDPQGTNDAGIHSVYYKDFLKGVTKPRDASYGNLALQVLATQSGGLALTASNDVSAEIRRCLADADSYYELTFRPPAATQRNEYRRLEVKVAKPDLAARTRMEYYAQP